MNYFMLVVLSSLLMLARSHGQGNDTLTSQGAAAARGRILIINSFDASGIKARGSKQALFRELADSLTGYLAAAIRGRTAYDPVVLPYILYKSSALDTMVAALMQENKASMAILIWSLDVYFSESDSKETTNDEGRPVTTTSYDLCAKNEYTFYLLAKILKQSVTQNCEYLTSRSATGSFRIQFGPDIVGKRKHTYGVVANNAKAYIHEVAGYLGIGQ